MSFWNRWKENLPKEKTKEELDAHYDGMDLEKGDFPAMIIAGLITFVPILLVIGVVLWLVMWLFGAV